MRAPWLLIIQVILLVLVYGLHIVLPWWLLWFPALVLVIFVSMFLLGVLWAAHAVAVDRRY